MTDETLQPRMRIAVFSDTHRNIDPVVSIIEGLPADTILYHLGDYMLDAMHIERLTGRRMTKVWGNNDNSHGGEDLIVEDLADDLRVFATHGHRYGVKLDLERLVFEAKRAGANLVLYGHTHVPAVDEIDGMMVVCPGAFYGASYMSYAEIDIGERIIPKIIKVVMEDAQIR